MGGEECPESIIFRLLFSSIAGDMVKISMDVAWAQGSKVAGIYGFRG